MFLTVVKAEEGKENYICKIVELFQSVDGTQNFTAQWYYRADDTVRHCEISILVVFCYLIILT